MTQTFEETMAEDWQRACAMVFRLGGRITAREFARHNWRFRRCAPAMLTTMVQQGLGAWADQPTGARGGRPTKVFVLDASIGADGRRVSSLDDEATATNNMGVPGARA